MGDESPSWYYYTRQGWQEFANDNIISDTTEFFKHSGIVQLKIDEEIVAETQKDKGSLGLVINCRSTGNPFDALEEVRTQAVEVEPDPLSEGQIETGAALPLNSISKAKSNIRLGNGNWLPAVEVYGEGIFFEFNSETLSEWAQKPDVIQRISGLNTSYQNSFFSKRAPGNIRPEFVLIHTFAHLFINQLSYECGYGSSSIRERIYCEKTTNHSNMCGVLIYTASGDSEGSLGGLVRQGEAGRLEDTILAAIHNAEWCSSDPICIESLGQGPESCNLAACHNCALLPETCCECGNRLLDRGTVIGVLDRSDIGYFGSLRNGG